MQYASDKGCQTDLTASKAPLDKEESDSASFRTLISTGTMSGTLSEEYLNQPETTPMPERSKELESIIVDWEDDNDPEKPTNFTPRRKSVITIMLGLMTFCVTFASSVFSTATIVTAKHFHVSPEVMVLATSLFVLGFAFGPIIFGPLSELYGLAVAQDLQIIFICRFLGGLFASAPLAIVSGILADLFESVERGIAVSVFAGATFIGPVAGPIVGGFITMSHLGWRWTEYITAIMAFFFSSIGYFIIPETFEATLLTQRAQHRRAETGNWSIHAQAEEKVVNPKDIATRYILRPFVMLAQEPILIVITLYMGFIYGFLYLCFEAYPIAFQEIRGWNDGVGALPFVGVACGVFIGCGIIISFSLTRYRNIIRRTGSVNPEERLIPMMIGGILLPAGIFWFGWTSSPHITWVPEAFAGVLLGAGVLLISLQVRFSSPYHHKLDSMDVHTRLMNLGRD
ncbi:hypothetical protein N7488_006548 [Penicillium malachiteum]|nr:hypothetical protein N7488_006548 [Penicillium malachiteum]